MGIGRNQYIDLMNQSRSTKKFGGFLRQLKSGVGGGGGGRDLLPPRVVETVPILPWWVVQVGYVTEEDMKVRRNANIRDQGCPHFRDMLNKRHAAPLTDLRHWPKRGAFCLNNL